MLEANNENEKVTLKSLSDLTGFPVEMIKSELFNGSSINEDEVSLSDLRHAMMSYIDETMLESKES